MIEERLYLIAEYCDGPLYMGWWLYVRESKKRQQRNSNGEWGWVRYSPAQLWLDRELGVSHHPCRKVFDELGITREIDGGSGDDGAIAEFASKHKIPRSRIGGKPRGCVEITRDEWGELSLLTATRPPRNEISEVRS